MKHRLMPAGILALAICVPMLSVGMPPARAQVAGSDKFTTSDGPVDFVPIHHAALMLTWKNEHILVDPAPIDNNAQGPAMSARYKALPAPDFILITHIHGDHFSVPILQAVAGPNTVIVVPQNVHDAMPADLQAKAKVMKNGDKATIGAVGIEAVPAYNISPDRLKFHPKGQGNGYVLTFANKRIYVAGDTEETPELAHLANIDVAFIPMNLPYTQTVDAAAKWVKDFRPKIVFPYHYSEQDGFADTAAFESLVGNASVVRLRKWY
jgi:L-ascorbate metabolism protein UlaG (beta-lactamase superfamily)